MLLSPSHLKIKTDSALRALDNVLCVGLLTSSLTENIWHDKTSTKGFWNAQLYLNRCGG